MPRTALQSVSSNLPKTPARAVKVLSAELDKKEAELGKTRDENRRLLANVSDLTKAFDDLQIVKERLEESQGVLEKKSKKRDPDAPKPAITAYNYFREANRKDENKKDDKTDWREAWKACQGAEREKYVAMAATDKVRFERENEPYQKRLTVRENEDKELTAYYESERQKLAMELLDRHMEAQKLQKEKEKKKARDPDAPKRPMSNYMYYTQENRADVQKTNPQASITEVSKILGEQWSKLNKGKGGKKGTKKYDDMAAKDRVRYEKEKEAYDVVKAERVETAGRERKEILKKDREAAKRFSEELRKREEAEAVAAEKKDVAKSSSAAAPQCKKTGPKRAASAYNFFVSRNREAVKESMEPSSESGNVANAELMSEIGRRWKCLSDRDKEPYNALAAQDKIRFEKESRENEEFTRIAQQLNFLEQAAGVNHGAQL